MSLASSRYSPCLAAFVWNGVVLLARDERGFEEPHAERATISARRVAGVGDGDAGRPWLCREPNEGGLGARKAYRKGQLGGSASQRPAAEGVPWQRLALAL